MSIRISDRVKETSLTTGTGALTLAGAFSSAFDTFSHGIGSGETFYVIENSAGWETGIGTVTGGTLTRDTVLSSSAGGALVPLVGTSIVFCGQSATKSVFVDSSGNLDLSRASGIVFPDGSLQTVAGGSPVSISGWADSTMSARDVLVSGWAAANDVTVSGWANSNDVTMSGWTQASDVALSGWANFRDNKVTSSLTTLIAGVSGWADLAMSARDALISGWAQNTFNGLVSPTTVSGWASQTIVNSGNAAKTYTDTGDSSMSGWALRTITNSGNAFLANDVLVSGWAGSTITNGDNAISGWALRTIINSGQAIVTAYAAADSSISGWASQTIVNSGNALATAYVAADTVVTNAFAAADSTISGWMNSTLTNSGVAFLANDATISGWAQSTFNGIPSAAAISGWASSTIVNSGNALKVVIDASGNAVSGWAQSTFNGIVSSATVSGWASQTITNSGAALSGWAQSTFNGLVSPNAVSGWISQTLSNSGANLVTADSNTSGWVAGTISNISGWNTSNIYAPWKITNGLIATSNVTTGQTVAISGASGITIEFGTTGGGIRFLQVSANPISGWMLNTLVNSGIAYLSADSSTSGWARATIVNSGQAISGWMQSSLTGNLSLVNSITITGGNLTLPETGNMIFGTATGSKIGTAITQKLAFYGSTPITQPSGNIASGLINLGLLQGPAAFLSATNLALGTMPSGQGVDSFSINFGIMQSGTLTPYPHSGNFQHGQNNGAHTLAAPPAPCTMILEYTNGGSAGALTTSAYTKLSGDTLTTVSGSKFLLYITKTQNYSNLNVLALQ